jgi:hypothetical protein
MENEVKEVQIFNPVLNEGLYLAEDYYGIDTKDLMFKKGTLLTVHVLVHLLVSGYEFINTIEGV